MRRPRSIRLYRRIYDKAVYTIEQQICRKYGLTNKKKELGLIYGLLRKYQGLGRREGEDSKPYRLAEEALRRKGILEQGTKMPALKAQDFLQRRLVYILSKRQGCSLRQARQHIIAGRVFYNGLRLRSPSALIPRTREGWILLIINKLPSNQNRNEP